jgi:hypothetical protein
MTTQQQVFLEIQKIDEEVDENKLQVLKSKFKESVSKLSFNDYEGLVQLCIANKGNYKNFSFIYSSLLTAQIEIKTQHNSKKHDIKQINAVTENEKLLQIKKLTFQMDNLTNKMESLQNELIQKDQHIKSMQNQHDIDMTNLNSKHQQGILEICHDNETKLADQVSKQSLEVQKYDLLQQKCEVLQDSIKVYDQNIKSNEQLINKLQALSDTPIPTSKDNHVKETRFLSIPDFINKNKFVTITSLITLIIILGFVNLIKENKKNKK